MAGKMISDMVRAAVKVSDVYDEKCMYQQSIARLDMLYRQDYSKFDVHIKFLYRNVLVRIRHHRRCYR